MLILDVLVHAESAAKDAVKRLNITINRHSLYPVIHKKWEHLSEPMEIELKKMKASAVSIRRFFYGLRMNSLYNKREGG